MRVGEDGVRSWSWFEAYSLFTPRWVGLVDASAVRRRSLLQGGDGRHGSLAKDPKPRIDALRRLILQLHRLYGQPAGLLNHRQRRVDGVDDGGGPVDLRVCVSGDCHVLDQLSDCEGLYRQETCHPDGSPLARFRSAAGAFEAWHAAETAGEPFDYIAYLEDDILAH